MPEQISPAEFEDTTAAVSCLWVQAALTDKDSYLDKADSMLRSVAARYGEDAASAIEDAADARFETVFNETRARQIFRSLLLT